MLCQDKHPFDFIKLWNITHCIYQKNPNDSRLFNRANGPHPSEYPSLTYDACVEIASKDFEPYAGSTIWRRLTTWKFPLFQLVALFPRPPLGFTVECFVLTHLLGDPVDTIKNLLLKLENCQTAANRWKEHVGKREMMYRGPQSAEGLQWDLAPADPHREELHWKALSLLETTYDEWGQSKQTNMLGPLIRELEDKKALWDIVRRTADSLAADRATKYLPAVVAEIFFIASITVAIWRTAAAIDTNSLNDTIFINLEIHSVACSVLYFWIIPTVFLGSVIGVSQTKDRIPRILRQFWTDLQNHLDESNIISSKVREELAKLKACVDSTDNRLFYGGIYCWQPSNWQHDTTQQSKPSIFKYWLYNHRHFLPYLIMVVPGIAACSLSGNVPPGSWDCRVMGEFGIFLAWLLSAEIDILANFFLPLTRPETHVRQDEGGRDGPRHPRPPGYPGPPGPRGEPDQPEQASQRIMLFNIIFIKDTLVTAGTIAWVIATFAGVMNRCGCWTYWGTMELILPQRPDIDNLLRHRLKRMYPAIVFTGIAIELIVFPLWIWCEYHAALKVFVQRDDGESNIAWLRESWGKLKHKTWGKQRVEQGNHGPTELTLLADSPQVPDDDDGKIMRRLQVRSTEVDLQEAETQRMRP